MSQPGTITIVLRPKVAGWTIPVEARLRGLLKHALRARGLVCERVEMAGGDNTPSEAQTPPGAPQANPGSPSK
jgi:hypothetical protein